GRGHARREPERLAGEHRRHRERDRQCPGHDAASRAGGGDGGRRHGRASDVPIAPRQPRRGRHLLEALSLPVAEPKVTLDLARGLGLTADEYDRIFKQLGREPSYTELGLFSALWSEHCAYKHSRVFLRRLPTSAPHLLQGPGENAGAIDIGDGWAVVFKIESHNHPSFIEPFQGAATGVGGILRDVFTMGARPIAILDSLRFGDPADAKTRHLVQGVVSGISWYGNCFGCPTVGGEIAFAPEYGGNPLVNVMCVGLIRADRIFRARAEGIGNPVFYVGNKTGRDGIHGATMAS